MRYEQKEAIQDNNKARIYAAKKKQDKLKQILAICEMNRHVDWVSADMEVFEEFDVIIKLLKEVIDEQRETKNKDKNKTSY